jgi:hypothetical protein
MLKSIFAAIVVIVAVAATSSANTVKRLDIYTSACEDCGMTVLGHLSVKVAEAFDYMYITSFN